MVFALSATPQTEIPFTSYSPGPLMIKGESAISASGRQIKTSLFKRDGLIPNFFCGGSIRILAPPFSNRKHAFPCQEIIIRKYYQILSRLTRKYFMIILVGYGSSSGHSK